MPDNKIKWLAMSTANEKGVIINDMQVGIHKQEKKKEMHFQYLIRWVTQAIC